ncbi:MAG TPA: zinc-binding dehydrogenase [Solirubrobacteraceae bacterium]|jgi:NADPH:quinone reductase-like Zn-dependent oxidoreductase
MRNVVLTKHGGPEVLQVQERPDPTLGVGEVRLQVAAAGVNFADVMARVGFYPDAPKPPCVLGYEVAGTVIELGEGAAEAGLVVGQRVVAGTMFGGYASEVVVPVGDVVALPDGLSFEQGAAIPVAYATAWAALIGYGNLQRGERVLIHAAAGGVGTAATQIARRHGAEVYGTASPSKHERIRELGVQHPLEYADVEAAGRGAKRGGAGEGGGANGAPGDGLPRFDLIMDALGGRSLRRSYELLRPGGRLVAFGASGAVSGERRNLIAGLKTIVGMPRFNLVGQMSSSKAVIGLNMLSLWKDRGTLGPWIEPLSELLADGTIAPVVAEAFAFDRAGEAHRMIAERRNVGKVVLVP